MVLASAARWRGGASIGRSCDLHNQAEALTGRNGWALLADGELIAIFEGGR
jgi:hypothetical protein